MIGNGNRMQRLLLFSFFLLFTGNLSAQSVVSGRIVDSLGQGIGNASISYKESNRAAILGYALSQSDGAFELVIKNSALDSIELVASHLAFRKRTLKLPNKTSSHLIQLSENRNQLQEVNVKPLPIYRRKDTVNYSVDAFTSKQDRVIGDIIRKLPGIEVQGDKIFYQGQPIQKYMVNNLDLMGGRYGVINNNLPAEAVRKVQIIENDQPIKVLDSLVFSDRASLNLELKRFTTTGTGNGGIGYEPILWDMNVTPMTFDKTFQSLYTFQSNNVGNDVSQQLRSYYTSGPVGSHSPERIDRAGPSFLAIQDVSSPGFDEKKWLDNRIFLGDANLLKKLENGLELRGNLSYHQDLQKREGFTYSEIMASDPKIVLSESIANRYRSHNLSGGILLEKNEKDIYLKNNLRFRKSGNGDSGQLMLNKDRGIRQNRQYGDYGLVNQLAIARFIGKRIATINSLVEYGSTPQSLQISPGQFTDIINAGEAYASLLQQVNYRDFRTENSISQMRPFRSWVWDTKIGVNYRKSFLQSEIRKDTENGEQLLGRDFTNDQVGSQAQAYLDLGTRYNKNGWRLSVNAPYYLNVFDLRQQEERGVDNVVRNILNPRAHISYQWGGNHSVSANSSYDTKFSGLDNLYGAYIMSSYRNIGQFRLRILSNKSYANNLSYDYANTRKATFANLSYSNFTGSRDYIFENTVNDAGLTTTSIRDQKSGNASHRLSGGASKFFVKVKTIVKLNGSMSFDKSDFLLNERMGQLKNDSYSIGFEATNRSLEFINFAYKYAWRHIQSGFSNGTGNLITSGYSGFDISIFPADKHSLFWNNAYYQTNIPGLRDQLFVDLTYRFTLPETGLDLEVNGINLLNNDQYVQRFNSEYALVESYFNLRPRQLMVSTRFRF